MKTFYKFGTASVLSMTMLSSAAFAGGLSDPVVETVAAPVFEPAPVENWTGFYTGLNLGYADIDVDNGLSGDDVTYGVHAGYDYDFGSYVLGGELEYDVANVDLGAGVEADSVTRLKLRGGYDLGRTLLYVTGGVARVDTNVGNENGEFLGLGVAYQVTDNFTVGGELLEHRFDDLAGTGLDVDATTFNLRGSFRF